MVRMKTLLPGPNCSNDFTPKDGDRAVDRLHSQSGAPSISFASAEFRPRVVLVFRRRTVSGNERAPQLARIGRMEHCG
jgi:hypothetical protein